MTHGRLGEYGDVLVLISTINEWTKGEEMDVHNNLVGIAIYEREKETLGRDPTEAEVALAVYGALTRGELVVNNDRGPPGWAERAYREASERVFVEQSRYDKTDKPLRDYFERTPAPDRGDALPPRDHDRMFDRDRGTPRDSFDRLDIGRDSSDTMIA